MKKISKKEVEPVISAELVTVTSNAKIEPVKAKQHALAFQDVMQEFHGISSTVDLSDETPTGLAAMKRKRLDLVKVRTKAETIKDERKKLLLAEGNLIQSLHNVVRDACLLTESEIKAVETKKEREEQERVNKLIAARELELEPYGYDTTFISLGLLDDDQFESLKEQAKSLFDLKQAKLEEEKQKEALRLKELEEENKRLKEAELSRKKEAEKETERKNKIFKARKPVLEKSGFEWVTGAKVFSMPGVATLDVDVLCNMTDAAFKQHIKEVKELEETRRKNKELEEQLKENQRLEKARLAKIETERLEAEAKKEADLKAPDKDKVKAFFEELKALELNIPKLSSKRGTEVEVDIKYAFIEFKNQIIATSKKLL